MRIAFCLYASAQHLRTHEFYGVDVEILRSLGHQVTIVRSPLKLAAGRFDLAYVWWWNYLSLWGPAARLRGIPVVATGVFTDGELDQWPAWKRFVKHMGTRFTRLNVLVSQTEIETSRARGWFRPESIRYSPLAVDTAVFTPGPPRGGDGPFTILNVAFQQLPNLRRKMVFELLSAFGELHREYPDTRLVLAGARGSGTEALAAEARASGAAGAIEFLGEITREEKIRRMQTCSLYVQVSQREGFGLAITEAMACGAPVLVAPTGEVPLVVDDCGVYVDQVSAEGIHAALRACVQRRAELPALGARARARVESTFGLARRRADLEAFLREATSG